MSEMKVNRIPHEKVFFGPLNDQNIIQEPALFITSPLDDLERIKVTLRLSGLELPKPTKTFINELPLLYKSWNALLEEIKSNSGEYIPNQINCYVVDEKKENIFLYKLDMDFIKARAFEEMSPTFTKIREMIGKKGFVDQHEILKELALWTYNHHKSNKF